MAALPSELITDILIRLPVKPLLRFRCISKPICSEIDGPYFTKLHLNHSTLTNSHRSITLSRTDKIFSLDLHSLHQAHEIDNPLPTRVWTDTVQVIGSCNGLLCLFKSHHQIVLWNPPTRKHLKVPSAFPEFYSSDYNVVYGFGYDSLHDDYKLLSINQIDHTYDSHAFVYSMKSNLWRSITGFPYCFTYGKLNGVFVSGAVHFIDNQTQLGNNCLIMAVDLSAEGDEFSYSEVPVPPDFSESGISDMGVLNECLSVPCCVDGGLVNVWVMKDYGVMESWTKLFSFCYYEFDKFYDKPVTTVSGGNKVIMHEDDADELLVFDLEENEAEIVNVVGVTDSFVADVYMESLVNPMTTATASPGDGKGTGRGVQVACSSRSLPINY